MKSISAAADKPQYWMAAAWQLERTQPNEFGLKTRVEHTGEGGGEIKHKLTIDHRHRVLQAAQASLNIDSQPGQKLIETSPNEDGVFVPDEN